MATVTIPTPAWISSFEAESVGEVTDSFSQNAKMDDVDDVIVAEMPPDELEEEFTNIALDDDDDDEDGEEFSFAFDEFGSTLISADDAFQNGQIRTSFPLIDSRLVIAGDSTSDSNRNGLPHRPPVQKVFIETDDPIFPHPPLSSSEDISGSESLGPYNVWSGKAVEASPEVCKKSNSTGFSKLWRFPKLLKRSNSDGKDAYIFFNGSSSASSSKKDAKTAVRQEKIQAMKMKSTKGKSSAINAHEHYLRSKEDGRRKSYLPYRPKLVGFFTNFHGGLRRNTIPF